MGFENAIIVMFPFTVAFHLELLTADNPAAFTHQRGPAKRLCHSVARPL